MENEKLQLNEYVIQTASSLMVIYADNVKWSGKMLFFLIGDETVAAFSDWEYWQKK